MVLSFLILHFTFCWQHHGVWYTLDWHMLGCCSFQLDKTPCLLQQSFFAGGDNCIDYNQVMSINSCWLCLVTRQIVCLLADVLFVFLSLFLILSPHSKALIIARASQVFTSWVPDQGTLFSVLGCPSLRLFCVYEAEQKNSNNVQNVFPLTTDGRQYVASLRLCVGTSKPLGRSS